MPGGVTLIRPDGSRLEGVSPADAAILKAPGLNYKEETPEEHFSEQNRLAEEAHWNTPGQKLLTGVEGAVSGASLGASDLLFGDESSRERARFNPGIRLGTELVGGFLAPVGTLGKAVETLAESKTIRATLRGAVEGAQYGAGAAVTNAQLADDPLTVEAVGAGIGWGGLFGGGLGALAGKAGEVVEARAMAERKALEKAAQEESALGAISEEKWGAVHGSVVDAKSSIEEAVKTAEEHVATVGEAEKSAPVYEHYSTRPEPPEVPPHSINPMSGGSGPNGVYTYQENATQKTFATDRPYKFRLQATGKVIDTIKYTAEDLAEDLVKLKKEGVDTDLIHQKWEKYQDNFRGPRPFAEFWYTITKAGDHEGYPRWSAPSVHDAKKSTELLNKIGRTAISDRAGVIYSSEPEQAAFFSNDSFKVIPETNATTVKAHADAATKYAKAGKDYINELTNNSVVTSKNPELRTKIRFVQGTLRDIKAAINKGDFELLNYHMEEFEDRLAAINEKVGEIKPEYAQANPPPMRPELPVQVARAQKATEAMGQMADMTAIAEHLKSFPVTAQGIKKLAPKTVEHLGGALDALIGLKSAEFQGAKTGLQESIQALLEHLGLDIKGSPGTQFKGLWETLRASGGKKATGAAEAISQGEPPWYKVGKRAVAYAGGYAGQKLAGALGAKGILRFGAYEAGKNIAMGLLNLKGMVLGHVAGKVADWAPKGASFLAKVGPRVQPLKTRLDGTLEQKNHSKQELMAERAQEIRASAMSMADTLYKSLQPLDKFHPDLAVGLHEMSLNQFKFLIDKLPQDPGNAFSALKSLWHPDEVATEKFSRYYEVFHDPVGVISNALQTHNITLEAAEGLREMWPELYSEFRGRMLEKIATFPPGKFGYNEQVHLGLMLGLPLHSTMTPHFIASHQQMFTERNQKLPMPPQTGAGGTNGGRPSGNSATAAQKVEQH